MAFGSYFRYILYCNSLSADSDNDELTGTPPEALTKSSGFFLILLVPSCAPISGFALVVIPTPIVALAPAFVPAPNIQIGRYTNKNLQRATKLALKLFLKGQEYSQNQAKAIQDTSL